MAGVEIIDGKMIEEFVLHDNVFISEANKLFDHLDTDGDGRVSKDQLVAGLDALFCSSEDDDEGYGRNVAGDWPVTRMQLFHMFDTSGGAKYVNRYDFQFGLKKLLMGCARSFAGTPVLVALHGEPFSLFAPVVGHMARNPARFDDIINGMH